MHAIVRKSDNLDHTVSRDTIYNEMPRPPHAQRRLGRMPNKTKRKSANARDTVDL